MIDIVIKGKTFKGKRSHVDVHGVIARGFHYNSMGPPDEKVDVYIGNRRYVTDIEDFHDHFSNTCWSVFDINKYTKEDAEIYLIPLDTQTKEK